jgi:DNA-binding NtrC family response regulator
MSAGELLSGQRILVIDDEPAVCRSCARMLRAEGCKVDTREDPQRGLEAAVAGNYDVILLDLIMPGLHGLELLKTLRSSGVPAEVIIITGHATIQTAVDAMREGAADYVCKPFSPGELKVVLERVVERSELIRENLALRQQLESQQDFQGIVGESPRMERVFWMVRRVAPTDGTVLITGESGTGKELVAVAIHRLSRRKNRPFLTCDCGSLAPGVLESELFGHAKGSFSGAIASKEGLFAAADRGTLFLDEVANISLETQSKLLRVLETKRVRRVGETSEKEVDMRLIAATNRDLLEMVKEGTFREDLYYRLSVVPIYLPPIRERAGDIPRLAMTLLERFRSENETAVQGFTPEAMAILEGYAWPGNVRELKNVVERLAILCPEERIAPNHLPPELGERSVSTGAGPLPQDWEEFKRYKQQVRDGAVQEIERRFLLDALRRADGNVTNAAEAVGMARTQFHTLMRKYGLSSGDLS